MLIQRHRGFTLIELMVVVTIIGIMTGLIAVSMVNSDPQKELDREARRFKTLVEMALEEAMFSQQEIGVILDENSYKFVRWEAPVDPSLQAAVEDGEDDQADQDNRDDEDGDDSSNDDDNSLSQLAPQIGVGNQSDPNPQWNLISDEQAFREYQLWDDVELILEVDQEQIDLEAGKDENQREQAKAATEILEEEEEELIPSIIILSSGELTPFTLDFYYADDSDEEILSTVSADETGRVWLAHEEDENEEDR